MSFSLQIRTWWLTREDLSSGEAQFLQAAALKTQGPASKSSSEQFWAFLEKRSENEAESSHTLNNSSRALSSVLSCSRLCSSLNLHPQNDMQKSPGLFNPRVLLVSHLEIPAAETLVLWPLSSATSLSHPWQNIPFAVFFVVFKRWFPWTHFAQGARAILRFITYALELSCRDCNSPTRLKVSSPFRVESFWQLFCEKLPLLRLFWLYPCNFQPFWASCLPGTAV